MTVPTAETVRSLPEIGDDMSTRTNLSGVSSRAPETMRDITHVRYPFGLYASGVSSVYALCPDGTVRRAEITAETADTFYSVPARVRVTRDGTRYSVSGYITTAGFDARPELGESAESVRFRPYTYARHSAVIYGSSRHCTHEYPTGNTCDRLVWSATAELCPMHES